MWRVLLVPLPTLLLLQSTVVSALQLEKDEMETKVCLCGVTGAAMRTPAHSAKHKQTPCVNPSVSSIQLCLTSSEYVCMCVHNMRRCLLPRVAAGVQRARSLSQRA